jgi:hypothetical protein
VLLERLDIGAGPRPERPKQRGLLGRRLFAEELERVVRGDEQPIDPVGHGPPGIVALAVSRHSCEHAVSNSAREPAQLRLERAAHVGGRPREGREDIRAVERVMARLPFGDLQREHVARALELAAREEADPRARAHDIVEASGDGREVGEPGAGHERDDFGGPAAIGAGGVHRGPDERRGLEVGVERRLERGHRVLDEPLRH